MRIISDFFGELSGRQRLFALVFGLAMLSLLVSFLTRRIENTIITALTIAVTLLATRRIWLPEEYGKLLVRRLSLAVILATATSYSLWKPFAEAIFGQVIYPSIRERFPLMDKHEPSSEISAILVFIFVLLGVFIVNYFTRDKTTIRAHPRPMTAQFSEKDFKRRRDAFCGILLDNLNKIDRETNWSAEYFVPLEAEVEVQTGRRRLRKVTDLLTAIKVDRKSRAFLVLGDPGSGKSVALRKLCRDLLKEVSKSDKIPIYINLREWAAGATWSEATPPTVQKLYDFVLENLKERGDVYSAEFLDLHFKKLLDHGYFFLVLDSFDEIPAVLDESESSWLIHELSDVIYKFIAGAHESRGVLASRIFRRPTRHFAAEALLEIRPLTESKIVEMLKKSFNYKESLIKELFINRQELVPIARNPFTAALISNYAKIHDNQLPKNQAELYASYIDDRLTACRDRIRKKNLQIASTANRRPEAWLPHSGVLEITPEYILSCATDMADAMFTTHDFGLEAPIDQLQILLPHHSIADVVDILIFGRLGRMGSGDEQRFSFSHRRFNEYFVTRRLIEEPSRVSKESIPTDSRWRDALVLYCEVAQESETVKIAKYCWSQIRKVVNSQLQMDDPQYLRAIHSLRFLREAFRSRPNSISSFRRELAGFIDYQIQRSGNLVAIKLAVEATGLLDERGINSPLVKALKIDNIWISETAMRSCRHLARLSDELEWQLKAYIDRLSEIELIRRRRELLFSLSLSSGFGSLREFLKVKVANFCCLATGLSLLFLLHPLMMPLFIIMYILLFLIFGLAEIILTGIVTARSTLSGSIRRSIPVVINNRAQFIFEICFSLFRFVGIALLVVIAVLRERSGVNPGIDEHLIAVSAPPYMPPLWIYIVIFTLLVPVRGIALAPWVDILLSIRNLKWKKLMKLSTTGIAVIVGALAFMLTLSFSRIIFSTFSTVFISVCSVGSLYSLGVATLNNYKDRILLSAIARSHKVIEQGDTNLNRDDMSEALGRLKTPWGRLKYVQLLESFGEKPVGVWPEGKLPNYRNDSASTLLAQLEERWLGLD